MTVEGAIDHRDQNYIGGWVKYPGGNFGRIDLDVIYRGNRIGRCQASITDTEVSRFQYNLPAFFPRGELNQLEVWLREPWQRLTGGNETSVFLQSNSVHTFSHFGGTWVDRADWQDELAKRLQAGKLSTEVAAQIERFAVNGFVIIEGAVSEEIVDAVNADIDYFWREPPAGMLIETFEPDHKIHYIPPTIEFRDGATKLLDIYAFSESARKAISPPKAMAFLTALFEDKPKAFQGLAFWTGSQQAIHKDSAYVKVDTQPMHLTASWLALEDVVVGTGELEYYVGSHRSPDYLFQGSHKWMENAPEQHDDFLASLHRDADTYGYERASFLAKKGDVLIWHADLAHGGAPVRRRGATRRSLVAHFCPIGDDPYYRRYNAYRTLEAETCAFVSNYCNVPVTR